MNEETERWIKAAKILSTDPGAQVLCPRCRASPLSVTDQPLDATHKERHLRCPKCNAYNSLRMQT
jgi:uncharacterized C2H2 Zn-finger protein